MSAADVNAKETPMTPAPEGDGDNATLEPPGSVVRLQGFQRDLQRRAGRSFAHRSVSLPQGASKGDTETFAARIATRHTGYSGDGLARAVGNAREEGRAPVIVRHPLSTPNAQQGAGGYAPEGPVSPPLILSQPPVPVASWLGVAPPAPERVEREPLGAERQPVMPAPIAPMETPLPRASVQTQNAGQMMTMPAVLWRREGAIAAAAALAERAPMLPVMPLSAVGAPLSARLPMQTAGRSEETSHTAADDDLHGGHGRSGRLGRSGRSPMDLKMPSARIPYSGMPVATPGPANLQPDMGRHNPLATGTVGRIPMLPRPNAPDQVALSGMLPTPANALAERAPARLYRAPGGRQEQEQNGMAIQRSEAGSTPAPNPTGGGAPPTGAPAGAAANPDAGGNDIQLLANEVWHLLKRRLAVEAERGGH